jgi:hypothetical protein
VHHHLHAVAAAALIGVAEQPDPVRELRSVHTDLHVTPRGDDLAVLVGERDATAEHYQRT